MLGRTLRKWFPRPTRPIRKTPVWRPRLGVEALEDRVVPATQQLGALLFSAADFTYDPVEDTYTAVGTVGVGLAPTAGEQFTQLVTFTTDLTTGSVVLAPGAATGPRFTVTNATLTSVVQGVPDPTLWATTGPFAFDAASLVGGGVPLNSGGTPFATSDGQFTLNDIRFADPTGGTTEDAQVKLQGTLGGVPALVGLSFSVVGDNFLILDGQNGVTLTGVDEAVSGGLSVGGLGFSISDLAVSYSAGQFTLTGATSFFLDSESVTADFVNDGLVVRNGVIQDFDLAITGNLAVGGLTFTTNNLKVAYTQSASTYAVTGAATAAVGGQMLGVVFGGGGTKGLTIVDGALAELDVQVVSSFDLLGLRFAVGTEANPATVTYSRAADEYTLAGQVSVPELFNASVVLGSSSQPGITIKDGQFQLDAVTVELGDVNLGAFTLDELVITYTTDTFTVTVDVWFPEGWKLGGTVGFLNGELNTIGFSIQSDEGIEIPGTGVSITGLSGEVQNLANPSDLIVSGSLTAVWGAGQLIQVTGGFLVDKDELVLDGSVSVLDGFGTGSGRLVLDWGAGDYSLDTQLSWFDGTFTAAATIDLNSGGRDLYVKAVADVNVPDAIPLIGGKTLGSLDFVVEWHADGPAAGNFVAAWTSIDLLVTTVDVGVKVDFDGKVSVIGASEVHNIDQPPPVNPSDQVYHYDLTFTLPEGSNPVPAHGVLHVRWPEPGGTQSVAVRLPGASDFIDQSDFSAANGLSLLTQYNTAQQFGIGIVGSSTDVFAPLQAGVYTVRLTSNLQFGQNDPSFQMLLSSFGFSRPAADAPAPPSNPTDLQVTLTLTGQADSNLRPQVTLYIDGDGEGYDGTPVPGAIGLPVTFGTGGNWSVTATLNLDGLLPLPYFVYASVNDGVNGPVYSAYSGTVTPTPLLSGNVTNPLNNGAPLSGLTVYIDLDGNGRFDVGTDPYTSTDTIGGFYAFDASQLPPVGTTFSVGVVVPTGFRTDPSDTNPKTRVRESATGQITADFLLDQFTSITGTVSADFAAGARPLQGWTVYLDADGSGTLDPGEASTLTASDGRYTLYNVPPNTTQTVTLLLQDGFYLTGSTPGTYTVNVGPGEFVIYGGNDFAVLPFSSVSGNVSGYALQNGTLSPDTTPREGWTVRLLTPLMAIDAGGTGAGGYEADTTSGVDNRTSAAIATTGVVDPAPQAVYQTARIGGDFSYQLNLAPGGQYVVRLHFAQTFSFIDPGDNPFDVAVNGRTVLAGYDVVAAAGGTRTATVEDLTVTADAAGTVTIRFTRLGGGFSFAQVNGIEVFGVVAETTTDASGNYSFDGLRSGTYAVFAEVPAGWRQVSPFASRLELATPTGADVLPLPESGGVPVAVAAADFDGDGTPDFAVLDQAAEMVYIYYNGDFDNPQGFAVDTGPLTAVPLTIVVADFAATGRPSIGVVDAVGNMSLLRNDGGGNFVLVPQWFVNVPSIDGPPTSVTGVAAGTFLPGAAQPQLAALVVPGDVPGAFVGVGYYDAGGNRTSERVFGGTGLIPTGLAGGDVNGDGWTDLLVGLLNQSPVLLYGGDNVSGQTLGDLPAGRGVVMGDFTGDGRPDLGIFDNNGVFWYAVQDQAGNFAVTQTAVTAPVAAVNAAQLVDVNGDLRPDLVWVAGGSGPGRALSVALNTGGAGGAAFFTPAQQTASSLAPGAAGALALAAADLDSDGFPDLVVADTAGGFVEIVRNVSAVFTPGYVVSLDGSASTGNNFVDVQLGQVSGRVVDDVNRDGNTSAAEPGRAGVTVYLDLDRDGRLDAGEPTSVTGPDGYYGFAGLAPGAYQVRYVDDPARRPTTADGGVREVTVSAGGPAVTGQDFGNAVGVDLVLTTPAGGTGDWTVVLNRSGRLEVLDRRLGVVTTRPLAGVHSLTVAGEDGRPARLTLDLAGGGYFALPGGVTFVGGAGGGDEVRVLLGGGNNVVAVDGGRAVIDGGLAVSGSGVERLTVRAGGGDDRVVVTGRAVARGGTVLLDGGAGDDVLVGGDDPHVLLGGAGTDTLVAGRGRGVLVGGAGADTVAAKRGAGAVLVGGGTVHDADEAALAALLAEWASGRDLRTRIANLTDGTGSPDRENGDAFLSVGSLVDDGAEDLLAGDSELDWFRALPGDKVIDRGRR
ncbi:MAG: hypothetical protein C0501_28925 [Isosphaera sp.]|nr:hypothetical protein [Isosphaera sp.]